MLILDSRCRELPIGHGFLVLDIRPSAIGAVFKSGERDTTQVQGFCLVVYSKLSRGFIGGPLGGHMDPWRPESPCS
jgi:hypothetical protein